MLKKKRNIEMVLSSITIKGKLQRNSFKEKETLKLFCKIIYGTF